jgi:rhamnose utilization protein RhaD (predicted bifunctional aldolase and dehydrogenase)/NAD(P)-dependent dehydrogenase (short-subunit alcohol dehydrogenase family)
VRKPGPALPTSRSRWDDAEARRAAAGAADPLLGARAYGSRLLGADPALVLAGGGNSSVKSVWHDPVDGALPVLWVKGSGADLARVEPRDFAPVDLERARRLLSLRALDDEAMRRELLRMRLDPEAPRPSVETLLHAAVPFRFVDHTHADAVLAVLLARDGRRRAEDLWGEDHVLIPYARPGFALAHLAAERWRAAERSGRRPVGLVLLHHGLVACGEDARESYHRMLAAVARARRALAPRIALAAPRASARAAWADRDLAALRSAVSELAGRPLVAALDASAEAAALASDPRLAREVARGPLTPDHVLLTKPAPVRVESPAALGRALERFARAYRTYFERHRRGRELEPADPAPRVVLLAGLGVAAFGESAGRAAAALEVARHTHAAALAAHGLGGYRPLPPARLFEVEYWGLERDKLRSGPVRPLDGRVALVTGAARGIGRAAVDALLAAGAAVAGFDLDATGRARPDYLGLTGDASDPRAVERALSATVRRFGGLDVLVSGVGVFVAGSTIAELTEAEWRRALELNATSHFLLLRGAAPLLEAAPGGGAVVVIGSRNVLAPGPGAAAYSASKAALTQLARVAALELAPRGVRVNVLHPDNVFDTGLWSPALLASRAARYGLTVEQYKRRNLLRREVRAADVGALAAALAGDLFRVTTGAQIPVDGGSDRVI